MKENFHVRFGERGGETRRPQGRKVRSAPTLRSGTTAYVAEQWGRRWITCDTSRVALALARTRLMAARYPYYLLADSPEGAKKETELSSQSSGLRLARRRTPSRAMTMGDIRKGFVYKRVPHVTLKSIANNEEIDAIHARWQAQLEPLRADLNAALGQGLGRVAGAARAAGREDL